MTAPVRVALVGGHPVILGVARLGCEAAGGIEIASEFGNGAEAVRLVPDASPDVVVLDLDLPDMDGLDVLRTLRADGYTGAVLILSQRVDGQAVLEAGRLGADGFLGKPDGLRVIGEAVHSIAEGGRVVDAALDEAAIAELGRRVRLAREGSAIGGALTRRERQILLLLADGLTTQQIARRLEISPRTVETHVGKLYRKLEVHSRVQAVSRAASLGLLDVG